MSVRFGKVMQVDAAGKSGVIRDTATRKDYFFSAAECDGEKLPPLYSTVSFLKDPDFKTTNVAMLVKLDQLPRAI